MFSEGGLKSVLPCHVIYSSGADTGVYMYQAPHCTNKQFAN